METKYHFYNCKVTGNTSIYWDCVAGNDFTKDNITEGAFIATVSRKDSSLLDFIFFEFNLMYKRPFLLVRREPDNFKTEQKFSLIFFFTDGTTLHLPFDEEWNEGNLFMLTQKELTVLTKKEIEHFLIISSSENVKGNMSFYLPSPCAMESSQGWGSQEETFYDDYSTMCVSIPLDDLNLYDKKEGAKLFQEYATVFESIFNTL